MTKLNLFESTVIGFFVGVVMSVYLLFVESTEGFVGLVLNWFSLKPVFELLVVPAKFALVAEFVFVVLVCMVYALILGLIVKYSNKSKLVIVMVLVFCAGAVCDQYFGSKVLPKVSHEDYYESAVAMVVSSTQNTAKNSILPAQTQYFGNEVTGDLNGDEKSDIAFLVSRVYEGENLNYLLVSLKTGSGYVGTNLLYLGDGVLPKKISIQDQIVIIRYDDTSSGQAMEKEKYAYIEDGVLGFVK